VTLEAFGRRVAALTQLRVADCATPVLARDDAHHLFTVLRARDGEEVVLTDGRGSWRFAEVRDGTVTPVSPVVVDPVPPDLTLYVAPIKGDRGEWAVAKATELGVTTIVPLVSQHLAVKFTGEAREKLLRRWRRCALEAAGQCRRTYDLVVTDPVAVAQVPHSVAVAQPGALGTLEGVRAIAIGPEGGFAPDEWSSAHPRIGLGASVLRSETAVVAAAVLLASSGEGWAMPVAGPGIGNDGDTNE
jgi:16S rRNA (uracil1498-N3)-methyltransferase